MYSEVLENYGHKNWIVIYIQCSFFKKFKLKKKLRKEIFYIVESEVVFGKNNKSIKRKIKKIIPWAKISIKRRLNNRCIDVFIK